jgi:hypothetical protein
VITVTPAPTPTAGTPSPPVTPPSPGTPVVVAPPPIPDWRWRVRYAFGIALILLAAGVLYLTVFQIDTAPTEGRKSTTFDRTFARPALKARGTNKPRVNHQVKVVTNKPSTDGGREEWLGASLIAAALFLALGGAFVDRERLSFKFGKNRGVDVGGPDPQTTTSAGLSKAPSDADKKAQAEIAVHTDKISKEGYPVQEAASYAATAFETGVPPPPEVKSVVDATAAKAEEQSLDLTAGQLALSAVKAFDAHSERGVDPEKAAERALNEVLKLSE